MVAIISPQTLAPHDTLVFFSFVFAGGNRVRMINLATGIITTFSGTGAAANSGDGGAASSAAIKAPTYISTDGASSLFIVAAGSPPLVRKAYHSTSAGWTIKTVLGGGSCAAFPCDALRVGLTIPRQFAIAPDGAFYQMDKNRVLKVTGIAVGISPSPSSSTTPTSSVTSTPSASVTRTSSSSVTRTASSSVTRTPSGSITRTASSSVTRTASSSTTGTPSSSITRTSSASSTASSTGSGTGTPTSTATASVTASGTSSPTLTPTRSYAYAQAFKSDSFLLLRYEYVGANGANASVPAFIEEWSLSDPSDPLLVQTLTLPLTAFGSNLDCTVFAHPGQGYTLARSKKGSMVTLPCISGVAPQRVNALSSYPPATYPRVIARLLPNGSIDTSQYCNDCFTANLALANPNPVVFSAIADESQSPYRYWINGNTKAAGGLRALQHGSHTTTSLSSSNYSALSSDSVRLYAAESGGGLVEFFDPASLVGETWPTVSGSTTKYGLLSVNGNNTYKDARLASANGQPIADGNGDLWVPSCNRGLNQYSVQSDGSYGWQRTILTPNGSTFAFAEGRKNVNGNFSYIIAVDCDVPGSVWRVNVSARTHGTRERVFVILCSAFNI